MDQHWHKVEAINVMHHAVLKRMGCKAVNLCGCASA